MIVKVFSVYDLKALHYGVPFFMPSVGGAVRAFGDLVNDPESAVAKHPGDYQLFCVGSFDDSKGILIGQSPVELLVSAAEFVRPTRTVVPDPVSRAVLNPLATASELSNGGK